MLGELGIEQVEDGVRVKTEKRQGFVYCVLCSFSGGVSIEEGLIACSIGVIRSIRHHQHGVHAEIHPQNKPLPKRTIRRQRYSIQSWHPL